MPATTKHPRRLSPYQRRLRDRRRQAIVFWVAMPPLFLTAMIVAAVIGDGLAQMVGADVSLIVELYKLAIGETHL